MINCLSFNNENYVCGSVCTEKHKHLYECYKNNNVKEQCKLYILFKNGRIGYIDKICDCDSCIERKQFEWFINDLNNEYLDCIKPEELNDEVLYIGESLSDAITKLNAYYTNKINLLNEINTQYRNRLGELKGE